VNFAALAALADEIHRNTRSLPFSAMFSLRENAFSLREKAAENGKLRVFRAIER